MQVRIELSVRMFPQNRSQWSVGPTRLTMYSWKILSWGEDPASLLILVSVLAVGNYLYGKYIACNHLTTHVHIILGCHRIHHPRQHRLTRFDCRRCLLMSRLQFDFQSTITECNIIIRRRIMNIIATFQGKDGHHWSHVYLYLQLNTQEFKAVACISLVGFLLWLYYTLIDKVCTRYQITNNYYFVCVCVLV